MVRVRGRVMLNYSGLEGRGAASTMAMVSMNWELWKQMWGLEVKKVSYYNTHGCGTHPVNVVP